MIVRIEKVREAIARAKALGARNLEEACEAVALAMGIDVEAVREVALDLADQDAEGTAA